ncbi:MAG: C10 family peptidase [Fibromonadaceae bacterium]|jgi:hypothetical protein|nr:C10 family peptidase [Fibromonadaceae bacterium]
MKKAFAATLGFAFIFTFSCSAVEDLLKGDNCSNNQPYSGYDPADIPEPSSDSSQLSSSSSVEDDENSVVIMLNDDELKTPASNNPYAIVEPLIQTRWDQGSPFNTMLPLVDGNPQVTGCGRIAWAQLLKYHNHPKKPTGISGVNSDFAYDWDNMLNIYYKNESATEQQINAVATLLSHIFLTGTGSDALVNKYGYDKSIQTLQRKYYDDAKWEAIIREQLDAGLPIYYRGDDPSPSSHAFYLDGYDNIGRFHIGRGALPGKEANSWFNLNNINTGGDRRWYNNQAITINIKPDAGGVPSYALALDTFAIGKKIVLANEQITVVAKINPQGTFPAGQVAVALVNSEGNIAAVVGATNFKKNLSLNFTPAEMVESGKYSLSVVAKPDGKDWEIITLYDREKNVPKSIDISVSEFRGVPGGGWGLSLRRFNVIDDKTTVSPNEEFTVDHSLSDVNSTTFPRTTSGVALIDDNNNIVEILGTLDIPSNANSNRVSGKTIKCKVPSTVAFGQYKLRIVVKTSGNDEWRVVTQTDGNLPTIMDFTVQEFSVGGGGVPGGNAFAGNGVCPY